MSKKTATKQASKAAPSVSDSSTYKKESKPRYFTKRLYIGGHGMVDVGEELTEAALNAWKKKTDVPIDNYVDNLSIKK